MVFILNIEPLKVVLNRGEDENKSFFREYSLFLQNNWHLHYFFDFRRYWNIVSFVEGAAPSELLFVPKRASSGKGDCFYYS